MMATASVPFNLPSTIDESEIEYHESIGIGSFGEVSRVTFRGKEAAAKKIRISEEMNADEILFLQKLKHPNIIEYYGHIITSTHVIIVTEYAANGSLYDYLMKQTQLPVQLKRKWRFQAAKGIRYLQESKILHRDIKSPNFFITANFDLKIGDFGIAKHLSSTRNTATDRGTLKWQAPEVFKEYKLSPKADIFALGIVLWELETCEEPYKDYREAKHLMWRIGNDDVRPVIPESCPPALRDLIQKCWDKDRDVRPDIDTVVSVLRQIHEDGDADESPIRHNDIQLSNLLIPRHNQQRKKGEPHIANMGQPPNESDLLCIFLLYGPSRSGKSATGNILLGGCKSFSECPTDKCAADDTNSEDLLIRVIDTPPTPRYMKDVKNRPPKYVLKDKAELTKSLLLAQTGPINFVMVVKQDQDDEQVAGCIQFLRALLGEDRLKDMMVIFTGTSDVDKAFQTILHTLQGYPDERKILKNCRRNLCFAFNDGDSEKTQTKREEILHEAKETYKDAKEFELVMIGQSQVGKSKVANNILGEEVFESVQETCHYTAAKRRVQFVGNSKKYDITIVDTPGFNSKIGTHTNQSIIDELTNLSGPSRILVLVMRMDREVLTNEEKNVVANIKDTFLEKLTKKLIIVFTRQDEYSRSFEEFLRSAPKELKDLLKQCHYRCVAFNNNELINGGGKPANDKQVSMFIRFMNEAHSDDTKLRLVLIGKTGTGKSSTGNTILKEKRFENKSAMVSVTSKCQVEVMEINGREIEIVDTPGLFDTRPEMTTTATLMEIARCLCMTAPGPHAFLLVISIKERFTHDSQESINMIRRTFGKEMMSHTIVVLTHVDGYTIDAKKDEAIKSAKECLQEVLDKNNGRLLLANNEAEDLQEQSNQVIEAVERMVACNEGRHYTDAVYEKVANRLRAYGAGNIAEMRQLADENPLLLLSIVLILAGLFSYSWPSILIMYVAGLLYICAHEWMPALAVFVRRHLLFGGLGLIYIYAILEASRRTISGG